MIRIRIFKPNYRLNLSLIILITLQLMQKQIEADTVNHDTNLDHQAARANALATQHPKPQPEPAVVLQQRPVSEIEINSIDGTSDRHHYEQPNEQPGVEGSKAPVLMLDIPVASNNDADLYDGPSKPEPRNQIDESQQQDPAIIDHRPNNQQQQQPQQDQQSLETPQPDYASAQQQQTTTLAPASTQAPQSSIVSYQQVTSAPIPVQQATQAPTTSANWYPQQTPVPGFSQPAPQNQQSVQVQASASTPIQFGSQVAPSNQVVTVQHPNSINAIIHNDHIPQSQPPLPVSQQQSQQAPVQISLPVQQQQQQSQVIGAAASNQQQQLVTVNGQPMILMNPNAVNGGRRISISGWLKGISSMLANIFNRREHGLIPGQPGSSLSHWIQLGPNSPHWLSNAQTALQQQQYQLHQQQQQHQPAQSQFHPQMVASTRYTTYVQAPAQVVSNSQSSMIPHSAVQQQQQQQQQIALPQATTNYQQPQSPQQVSTHDLQASSSSNSYATVAPPMQYNPPQTIVQIGGTAPASISQATMPLTRQPASQPIQQQQQQQTQMVSNQQHNQVIRVTPAPQQQQSQQQQQQQQPIQQGARFSRSSVATSSGLPLAHYSRYATTSD